MKTKKIDLKNFTQSQMVARLYVFVKNFNLDNFKKSEELNAYCKKLVVDNFILPEKSIENCAFELYLFLLGSDNSKFSQIIKQL